MPAPLLTHDLQERLRRAAAAGEARLECSLDLGRTVVEVELDARGWRWQG